MRDRENWGMSESLILALMAIWVARVTGDCGKPPQLENGDLSNDFRSVTSFPVGTRVSYTCYVGYVFREGTSKFLTCGHDSVWGPLRAVCEPRSCGNPGEISNGYYEAGETTFGHKAIFHCEAGYRLVGRHYRMCQADGWDGQVPTCEIVTCDDPEPISNGKISSPSGDTWQYGMIATYSCLDEYTLIGEQDISCTSSGKWNKVPPLCKVVSCQRPPRSENIDIVSGFGPTYKYRDTITYRCARGYVMVGSRIIECSADNTFVPSPPICKLPTSSTTPSATSSTTPSGTAVTTAVTPIPKADGQIAKILGPIGGCVAVCIIACVIWYLLMKKKKKKKRHTTFEKVAMNTETEQIQVKSNVADN
ncbi:C4b-binding protein alpha chain-like isoform X4 [Mustelus asterias]